MRITLRQMVVFDAVARLGGVSQAAREIALTQSAVSMALKELERNLGTQLFHRHSKKLVLNDNGKRLQPKIRSALLSVRDVESVARDGGHQGSLSIGASTTVGTYLLPDICADFLLDHPGVEISLTVAKSSDVLDMVDSMALDLGFIESPSMRQTLRTSHWLRDDLVVFCAARHPFAGKRRVKIQELAEATWCLQPIFADVRGVLTRAVLNHVDYIRVAFETGSIEAIKRAVIRGVGIGCQSRTSIQAELDAGILKEVVVDGLDLTRQINIIYRKDIQHGELHAAFLQRAREFAEQRGGLMVESRAPARKTRRAT